jgi:hypothetical protein
MKSKSGKSKKPQRVPTKSEDVTNGKSGRLTIRQSRFAKILSERAVKSHGEAAVLAGLSPKNPRQSAYQALESIRNKAPEVMDALGLSLPYIIDKHLRPLMEATETKVFAHEGEITDYVDLADNTTRRYATNMALELRGAYPTEQEKQQGSLGVEVIVVDIARPDRSGLGVKVTAAPPSSPPRARRPEPEDDPRPRD